jgi:hypothetical protein
LFPQVVNVDTRTRTHGFQLETNFIVHQGSVKRNDFLLMKMKSIKKNLIVSVGLIKIYRNRYGFSFQKTES